MRLSKGMLATIRHPASVTPQAPPLVIAHGLYGSGRNWGVIARRLADRRDVVAVDMRNHGDSPRAPTQSYPDMAADLAAKLKRAGRMLPKKVRDSGRLLATSAHRAQNPKLLGQIDMGEVTEAYDVCVKHLIAIDPVSRRRNLFAGVVGSVGFGVLVLAVAILGFLAWRGYF